MNIWIMSRLEAHQACNQEDGPPTAIISIANVGDAPNNFNNAPWLKRQLHLYFDDVVDADNEANFMISEDQAKLIVDFVKSLSSEILMLIVHCVQGVSRSAAVAQAINEYIPVQNILSTKQLFPNQTVYKRVSAAFKLTSVLEPMQPPRKKNWLQKLFVRGA
jgi:predicted protein tyrosine phosphatase